MKKMALAMAFALTSTFAMAQTATTPPATENGDTPAVATPDDTNPTAPVAGKNSFTENQAKERLEEAGYSGVTGLTLDANGVWRGKATKGGAETDVGLDYQGNIVTN